MKQYLGKVGLAACAIAMLGFTSCQKDFVNDTESGVSSAVLDLEGTGEIKDFDADKHDHEAQLKHFNTLQVNTDIAEERVVERPDGTTEKVFVVGGDIEMTREQYKNYRDGQDLDGRQYSTNNLVSNNQTITVIGYTSGNYALTTKMRTGLSWAIDNYNSLNIGLNFSLSFSGSTNADIVVYRQYNNSGAGGVAGFPSGGNPYKWVQIYAGMDNYSNNVNEHVVGHEIGHCLGLRHTDYFSRQSCGQNTNEGSAGVGANFIPGTLSGYDSNSLMLACFSSSEDGEFGYYDRVALEYLY